MNKYKNYVVTWKLNQVELPTERSKIHVMSFNVSQRSMTVQNEACSAQLSARFFPSATVSMDVDPRKDEFDSISLVNYLTPRKQTEHAILTSEKLHIVLTSSLYSNQQISQKH